MFLQRLTKLQRGESISCFKNLNLKFFFSSVSYILDAHEEAIVQSARYRLMLDHAGGIERDVKLVFIFYFG